MPDDGAQRGPARHLIACIDKHVMDDRRSRSQGFAEQTHAGLREHVWIMVGQASEHDAVDLRQVRTDCVQRIHAAIDDNAQSGEIAFQAVDVVVFQRRHFAVVFRREAFEHRIAGVHEKGFAARVGHRCDKVAYEIVSLDRVNAEAMLDGHRDRHCIPHRLHAIGNQLRLRHQAGAEGAVLHALGRAAAVQVDFVITVLFPEAGALREFGGIGTTQLQRNRMLGGIEAQMPLYVAVDQRAGRNHFRVQHGVPGKPPEEVAAVAVRPVHHRRRAQAVVEHCHAAFGHGTTKRWLSAAGSRA